MRLVGGYFVILGLKTKRIILIFLTATLNQHTQTTAKIDIV